jgi:hypothetical protein
MLRLAVRQVGAYVEVGASHISLEDRVDRQQKIDRIANQSGEVSKVSDLEVRWTSLDPNYGIAHLDGVIGETGKLEILKVVPISGSGPYFIARWDQGVERIDIDMHGASRTAVRKFKARMDGYSGHHTSRSTDPDKRVFDVKIKIPTGIIFEGTVSFSNTYDMRLRLQSSSKVTVDMTVIRAKQKS